MWETSKPRMLLVSVAACAATAVIAAAACAPALAGTDPTGTWQEPRLVTHNVAPTNGDLSNIHALSCSSAGNCGAVGHFSGTLSAGANHTNTGFTVNESSGTWGGAVMLDPTDNSFTYQFADISCASPGNCAAVGGHAWSGGSGFVMDEVGGVWGSPLLVAPSLDSVSCSGAGECTAVGTESDKAAAISETSGVWGAAVVLPGTLNVGAGLTSVSCVSSGNCAAGGYYQSQSGGSGPLPGAGYVLVAGEANGTWGSVQTITGPFTGDANNDVDTVTSISCSSAGNCGAAGYYGAYMGNQHAFVVSEVKGTWQKAVDVADSLGVSGALLSSISCPTDGGCTAVGSYFDSLADRQALVVSQSNGTWKSGHEAVAALNVGGDADLDSVSCVSAGNCSAGGWYTNSSGGFVGLVVTEVNGAWSKGDAVATSPIADGLAQVNSISCPSLGSCTAGGVIDKANGYEVAFVVDETPGGTSTSTSTAHLRVQIRSRHAVVSHGRAKIKLACSGTARHFCHGELKLTVRERVVTHVHHHRRVTHHTIVLAHRRYRLEARHTEALTVHLTRAARRLLKHARHHRLRARARATVTGGRAASRTITL